MDTINKIVNSSLGINAFRVAGFITLAKVFSGLFRAFQFYVLYHSDSSKYKPSARSSDKSKAWALVTGASDGIGRGFAEELCARGFNVILHGRNEKKLMGVKGELEKQWPDAKMKLLVMDAGSSQAWSEEDDQKVLSAVRGLNLTLLVNNVGGSGGIKPECDTVANKNSKVVDMWMNLNARFMTQITRVLLPVLTKDKNQGTGICNISSGAELAPSGYLTIYAATKAYMSRFSICLDAELRDQGHKVDIMSAIVGNVATNGTNRGPADQGWFCCMPSTMAQACLNKMGNGDVVCTPWAWHGLEMWAMLLMPTFVVENFMMNIAKEVTKKNQRLGLEKKQ